MDDTGRPTTTSRRLEWFKTATYVVVPLAAVMVAYKADLFHLGRNSPPKNVVWAHVRSSIYDRAKSFAMTNFADIVRLLWWLDAPRWALVYALGGIPGRASVSDVLTLFNRPEAIILRIRAVGAITPLGNDFEI